MGGSTGTTRFRFWLWLIRLIGVIVPRRLRADWRQEWESELQYREELLAEWDKLNWRSKFDLMRRSLGAFRDALWMQSYRWEDEMIQDIRFALRVMIKNLGFTFVAILTLALGIGVNTAILSIVNGFFLRPLPVEKAEELVMPFWGNKSEAEVWGNVSYMNYVDLRDQNKSLSGLLAWRTATAGISTGESQSSDSNIRAELALGELVSSNYFDVLGVSMSLGRGFLPEENRTQNTHAVAVLSHKLWQQRFNSDASALGKTIFINGYPFTVIGVAPEYFKGLQFAVIEGFWVPLMMQSKFGGHTGWENDRAWSNLAMIGRLKPGVTIDQADADLNLIAENLAKIDQKNIDTKVQVVAEADGRFSKLAGILNLSSLLALSVSGLVLLVACANVANLLLARAAARSKEIGIRLAIGAGRFRIIRQLLTESVILSLAGGALGLLFAYQGIYLFRAALPPFPVPIEIDINPDLNVLKWMLIVSALTGILFGLAPALLASRPNLVAVIRGDTAGQSHNGRRRWNLRGALVIAQIATSIIVLVCAGLFLRSMSKAIKVDTGVSVDSLITTIIDPGLLGYDENAGKQFYKELLNRIESQPGVHAASLSKLRLLSDNYSDRPVLMEGEPDPPTGQGRPVDYNIIAPNYFETIGTRLVMGRDFNERDTSDTTKVAIVNQEFARRFYGNEENAIGKRIRFWNTKVPLVQIVGVAKDTHYRTLYDTPQPFIFLPQYQDYASEVSLLISANSISDLRAVVESMRHEVSQLDARMPVFSTYIGDQNLSYAFWGPRIAAGMATTFGILALVLATMGLYSVMTYTVSQRTREVGIRMALGAQISDVLRMIIGQGMRLAIIGIVTGLIGAFFVTRLLSSLLFGIGATDPITFIGVAILLAAVALLACWIPARRAAKVDPLTALRYE